MPLPEQRAAIVAEARTWIGTPYGHQQRTKGRCCDCAGLITETSRARGLSTFDIRDYDRLPDGRLLQICREQMTEIPIARMQPGDVVAMAWDLGASHLGIVAPYPHGENVLAIIHADNARGRVVEHRIDANLRRRIVAAFRLPGVDE